MFGCADVLLNPRRADLTHSNTAVASTNFIMVIIGTVYIG